MTNLNSSLSSILVDKHKSQPISQSLAHLNDNLDAFLKEAYQINSSINSLLSYLRAIRQPYLSSAPPPRRQSHKSVNSQTRAQTPLGEIPTHLTDPQREDIDSQTSALLRDINGNITNLQHAANLRHDTSQRRLEKKYGKPGNFLLRWAAGGGQVDEDADKSDEQIREEGEERTIHTFREGVLWYLNWALKTVVGTQQEMVGIRLEREREKRASILYDERNRNVKLQRLEDTNADMRARDTYDPALEANTGQKLELSPEQMQLFEEENSSLLTHYNDQLTQVTQAEKSLVEISSLQQTLVGHLSVQGEMIGQLVSDAERTDENVQRGNKELKRASERTSTAKWVYHSTIWLCAGLIVWDLIF